MWPQSQNNGIFRGPLGIGPPLGVSQSQFTYLGKIEVPVFSNVPSNDLAPESSKKRKAESMGQPGNEMSDGVSQSVSENCWLNEFHEHHKFGGISEMNVQVNNQSVFSNQPYPVECSIEAPQPARHQSNSQNSLKTPISEGTFHNTAVQNLNNCYSRMQPPSFHQLWSSTMTNSAAMNIPTFHDMQYTEFNKSGQIDASKPPYLYPGNINMEGAHVGNFPRNDVNSGGIYSVSIGKLSSPRKPSESVRSSEVSYLQNEKSDHFVELNGTTHVQDMSKTGSSFKWNRSGQSIDSAEAKDISRVRMDSLGSSECSPMNERDQSYEVRASIAPDNVASANGRDQSFGDRSIQLIKKEKSNMGAMTHSEEVLPKNDTEPSWYLNGKRTVVNKLWDGFVQLNSSTTVSAVAFFKSGEKAPEINWSKSIEVKGKVRLEAFEKFIQELPRSRSRGLMVISLCWKVGSSETGLTGMKEVAKAYKQGRRVGYAQPSAGIDLYVCPRSDTIITILAKYGFFKGMAAVEDDQDSLIGCVVWRRKHSPSDPVSTKGETKSSPLSEQPLYTYNTVIQETADAHTPLHTELVGGSIPLDSQKKSAPPGSTGNNHNQISTDAFYPQDNSVNRKPTLSSDSTSPDNHMKAEMKTSHVQSSEQGKYGFNSEIPRPVLLVPLQNINVQSTPHDDDDDDDDDLPEFDFSFACGVSRQPVSKSFSGNNAHVSSAPLKKNVPAEGAKNANGLIPSTIPIASQQSPSLPPTSNTNPPSLPPKEINQGQSLWHGPPLPPCPRLQYLQLPEQHHGVTKAANSTPQHPPKNHLWNDDDDMPEWCPPDFEHGKQLPSVTNARTSVSCAPTPAPNPTSEKLPPGPSWGMPPLPHPIPVCPPVSESLPPGPPWRLPTSPPSMPVRPPLPTQGFPTGYLNLPVRPPQVRPVDLQTHIGARSPSVPAPDSTLRPQANMFDNRPPLPPPHMRPAGWRGWRP